MRSSFLDPLRPRAPGTSLRNGRTGRVLAGTVEAALTSATRRRGLLGRDALAPGHALVLAPCSSIHTCFMRFPIDVVFVARNGCVLKICPAIGPWRLAGAWGAYAAIEMPAGGSVAGDVQAGDQIEVVASHPDADETNTHRA